MNSKAMASLLAALGCIGLGSSFALGASDRELPRKPDYDVRLPADRASITVRTPTARQLAAAEDLARRHPGLTLRWDGMSGSPRWIAAPPGTALSAPCSAAPQEIARSALRVHSELLGLEQEDVDALRLSSIVTGAGGVHVHFVQSAGGLEVVGGGANVNVDGDGSVRSIGTHLFAAIGRSGVPSLACAEAARIAARDVYPDILFDGRVVASEADGERRTVLAGDGMGREVTARLVVIPMGDGSRLAWEIELAEPTLETDYLVLVDALDGTILLRRNRTLSASARVVTTARPEPRAEEIAPASHELRTIPAVTAESPLGWISDPGTELAGNNVTSHRLFGGEPGLSDPGGVYDRPFNTLDAALVNAWWWCNDAHDRFYRLGFDEPAGNYQQDNFGRGGLGGDPMAVVARPDGTAYFVPAVDGSPVELHLGWSPCRYCGDHDGWPENGGERHTGFDRAIVHHEYIHGVSVRMVGGPAVADCLFGTQSGALGEGWSDALAGTLFSDSRGAAFGAEGYGSIDLRQDLDYADLCEISTNNCEVHADGMIWEGTLWEIYQSLVALDPVGGAEAFHRITVESLARIPCYPDMVDARDAMLEADTVLYGSAYHTPLWNVFAQRGFGHGASSTGESDTAPTVSYTVPSQHACTPPAAPTGLTATPAGDNAVRLDYAAPGAASVEIWREEPDNPLDRPERIGYTVDASRSTDDTVQGGKRYRYQLVALGAGGTVCRSGASASSEAVATGACAAFPIFDPQLTVSNDAGSCSLTLQWAPAIQGCPGEPAPIVYNVYRYGQPGFEPMDALLIARTASTTLTDTPPQDGRTYNYLVLAQHGTPDDPPDSSDRGSSQALRWVPGVPALGRTTVLSWSFDAGADGWTTDNAGDPPGGWVLVAPHGTRHGGIWAGPDLPAGGAGTSWVTGDAVGASSASNDVDGNARLISPVWDGTNGATLLSFDYWNWTLWKGGSFRLEVSNGSQTVNVSPVSLMTVQPFDTGTDRGWQRAEVDLANHITPSAQMRVTFVSQPAYVLSEAGVDNVRVDRATSCARSSLRVGSMAIDDTAPGWGNGNLVLEPGETARLSVTLVNDGGATAVSPVGWMTAGSPGVLVHEPREAFPDIAPLASGASLGTGFTLTAPSGAACLETIVLDFRFEDAAGTTVLSTQGVELGAAVMEPVFADTFETDKGWMVTGTIGRGIWQRGDPVGTKAGGQQANPEYDSPSDTGSLCYVTENGVMGGAAEATDADCGGSGCPSLLSPPFSLSGYKRARYSFDLWYFDNSATMPQLDFATWVSRVEEEPFTSTDQLTPTGGWTSRSAWLLEPMIPNHSFLFTACGYGTASSVAEMGVDNFRIEGERRVCSPSGVTRPPNGVGSSVTVARDGGAVLAGWDPSVVDPSHDAAAFYRWFVSSRPDGGFLQDATTTGTAVEHSSGPSSEFYLVGAVNAAGTSGDEPAP